MSLVLGQDNDEDAPSGGTGEASPSLEIGLLNNMPDAALQATERQFARLLAAAAGSRRVRLHLFALAEMPRGAAAGSHIRHHYTAAADLSRHRLDGLLVTGSEPRAPSLPEEPYWNGLTAVIDWAETHTRSSIWSCLAAHAAVLHLDGIARHRLPAKRFGVFPCSATGDHSLLTDAPAVLRIPHSRENDLREADLLAHGYQVLTRSADAGADLFVKRRRSLFVFFQGHPEYDADSLAREYRRDVGRFLRGERALYPGLPSGYFNANDERALAAFAVRAQADPRPALLADFPNVPAPVAAWRASAVPLYRNWLDLLQRAQADTAAAA